jgi:hypothetical protein
MKNDINEYNIYVADSNEVYSYNTEETIQRIITLTDGLTKFWKSAHGWAPIEAAELLSKSRLDWQASLAKQLHLFENIANEHETGLLILAWTTLGSLTEGIMKLFLSVFYKDYHAESLKVDSSAIKNRKGNLIDPDSLMLEKLKVFFSEKVWPEWAREEWIKNGEMDWINWINKIQQRRNAIHAFKDRDIGSFEEFHKELKNYLLFMRKLSYALPYPDDIYQPREVD